MRTAPDIAQEVYVLGAPSLGRDTTDDHAPKRYHAIAAQLAEHVEGPPAGLGWWVAAMGGTDGSECTLADVARLAGVPYAHAYYARYADGEAERICAILTPERDAVFGTILDRGEAHAREYAAVTRMFGEDSDPHRQALATIASYARAREAIRFTAPPSAVIATPSTHVYPALTCPKCNHTWHPRVQRPRKCPNVRCQWQIAYIDADQARDESPETVTPQRL